MHRSQGDGSYEQNGTCWLTIEKEQNRLRTWEVNLPWFGAPGFDPQPNIALDGAQELLCWTVRFVGKDIPFNFRDPFWQQGLDAFLFCIGFHSYLEGPLCREVFESKSYIIISLDSTFPFLKGQPYR